MKKVLLLICFSTCCTASEFMELGNLDIKGKLNLPSYTIKSDLLTLDSSLLKVAKIAYNNNSLTKQNLDFKVRKPMELLSNTDFDFDLSLIKVRLK